MDFSSTSRVPREEGAGSAEPAAEVALSMERRVELRRQALAEPRAAFESWSEAHAGGADIPHFVELIGRSIELGAWERQALRQPGAQNGRSRELLAEGVAYQARCLELDQVFESGPMPPPAQLPAFLDDLVTTLAVGKTIAEELQGCVDRLITEGQLPLAKSLATFRSKVLRGVGGLADHLGVAQLDEADRRMKQLVVAPPRRVDEVPFALREDAPAAPSWATYRERPPVLPPWLIEQAPGASAEQTGVSLEASGRVRRLVLVLLGLLLIYGVVMTPRLLRPSGQAPLALDRFSHLESVRGVMARPPSLFVLVDPQSWQAASVAERAKLLEEIGAIAGKAGYSGAHARTTDGITVGQWLAATGVRLISRPDGAT